ncbi:MAG: tetratricopeptide repeat protein, partial [bacterium]
ALNNIGATYYSMGNYLQAVELYKKALAMQEKIGGKKMTAIIAGNIGGIYSKVKDYSNAMKYISKADTISKELNDFLLLCFNREYKMRPTAEELIQHPFFKLNKFN